MVDYIIYMEEIVYSNVQAKSCTGSCAYYCDIDSIYKFWNSNCSTGCSCSTSATEWTNDCNDGSCVPGYDTECSIPCS